MASKKTETTALEKKPENTALAGYDYGEDDAGAGFEHQTKADTSIPFIVLLQGLSPIVVEGKAHAGNWLNTVTEEVWGKNGFLFVPSTTRHYYGEWTPRDEGGGFHGNHEIDSAVVRIALQSGARMGKLRLENGHDLVESFYVYGVICTDDGQPDSMGVMAFKSTHIRSYKSWMTRMRQLVVNNEKGRMRPPLYAHLSRVQSELKKNDKGQFYVPDMTSADPSGLQASLLRPDDERFMAAKQLKELVDSGEAKIDPNQQNQTGGGEEETPF